MKIMSKNFLKAKKENTAEVHIAFAVKPEGKKRIMAEAHKFAISVRRRYGSDYLIEAADAAGHQVKEVRKEESPKPISVPPGFWATKLTPNQKAKVDRIDLEIERGGMTKSDASGIIREVAKNIEGRHLVLNDYMRSHSPEYCETYRKNIPQLLNMAADLLDAEGQFIERVEHMTIEQAREINRNFENKDETLISYEFSTVNVFEEPSQVSHVAPVLGEDMSVLPNEGDRP